MRLSTSLIYQNGLNSILNQESSLSRLHSQLASGKRVQTPADDPLAASQAVNLSQTQSLNDAYAANRDTAVQNLGAEENALASIVTTLQDVLQRVVEAGNGTLSDADRQSLATVLTSQRDQLLGLANSTDGNGLYLFSGYAGQTEPYGMAADGTVTYRGDSGQRTIQVDQTRRMASGDVGPDIFSRAPGGSQDYITAGGPGNTGTGIIGSLSFGQAPDGDNVGRNFEIRFSEADDGSLRYTVTLFPAQEGDQPMTGAYVAGQTLDMNGVSVVISGQPAAGDVFTVQTPDSGNMDMFATLNQLISALEQPIQDDPAASATLSNTLATANKTLQLNLDNVLTVRASVGSRMLELEALDSIGEQKGQSYTEQMSALVDVDIYQVTSDLMLRQVALQAASQSFTRIVGTSLFSMN